MPVIASLQIQQGVSTNGPGFALVGVITTPVVLSNGDDTNVRNWKYTNVGKPTGSAVPSGIVSDSTIATYTFVPDLHGTYVWDIEVRDLAGNISTQRKAFIVPEVSGRVIPGFDADEAALLLPTNTQGWHPYLEAWLKYVDTISGGGSVTFAAVNAALGAANASIGVNNQKITNLATPTVATDAVTKAYADAIASGLSVKTSVRAVAVANITLSGAQTIDGVAVVAGNRVLVVGQSTASQNGIYVAAAGAWARSSDLAAGSDASGVFAFVEEGTVYSGSGFTCNTASGSAVVGTNSLTFTQFSGAGEITNGLGLTKTGNTLAIDPGLVGDIANVSTAAAAGVLARFARADHAHLLNGNTVASALSGVSSAVSVNNQKITNLATPVAGTDAATKAYADSIGGGGGGSIPMGAVVATDESTGSTTYVDLATTGPSVTLTTGSTAIVVISADSYFVSGAVTAGMSVDVSGATTIAANDINGTFFTHTGNGNDGPLARVIYFTGLTPGVNTFTAKYRVTGSTGNFRKRTIEVDPQGAGSGGGTTRGVYASLPGSPVDSQRYIPSDAPYELISFGGIWYQNIGGIYLPRPPLASVLSIHTNFAGATALSNGAGGTLVFTADGTGSHQLQTAGDLISNHGSAGTAVIESKCAVITNTSDAASASFRNGGIYMRESSSGKVAAMFPLIATVANQPIEMQCVRWTGNTTQSTPNDAFVLSPESFFRIRIAAGVLYNEVCEDGYNWKPLVSNSVTTYFTTAPDEYGVVVSTVGIATSPCMWAIYPYLKLA